MGPDDSAGAPHPDAHSEPPATADDGAMGEALDGPVRQSASHGDAQGQQDARDEPEPAPIDLSNALHRIDTALATLDATVDRHLEHHLDNAAAAAEVQRLNADRARLARALDEAEARAARLDEVNRDVSRRLVAAMETIRDVLES